MHRSAVCVSENQLFCLEKPAALRSGLSFFLGQEPFMWEGGSCPMCFLLDGQTCRLTRRMNDCASILYRNSGSFSFRSVPGGAFAPCYSSSQTSFGFHANNLITCLIGECESNGEVPNGHRKTRPRQTIPVFLLRPYAGYGLGARKRVCGSGKSAGTARARAERAIRCCIWRKRIRRCAIWRC